jgi:3-oxoacyl-[acyl-carrier-protein] synthase-1
LIDVRPLTIVAATLTNCAGTGWAAVRAALRADASGLRPFDLDWGPRIETCIGRVDALERVRLPTSLAHLDSRNNRLAYVCIEQDGFVPAVEAARRRHGADRIGVFIGTTTSGIQATERTYREWLVQSGGGNAVPPDLDREAHNMQATAMLVRSLLSLEGPVQTLSTACSSSAKAFGGAARFIAAGICDAAVVGGVDSLALSTLFGFKSLGLVSARPCRPFDAERDGISIGEGAGFALLERGGDGDVVLAGCGESSDAWHMSSPHPEGAGAAAAMRHALATAHVDAAAVDYVNLHGTASVANDSAEDRAVTSVFGTGTAASSTKGVTGHTLGAAGITEALVAIMAVKDQWIPGTANCDRVDPSMTSAIVREARPARMQFAISNSFGFGGSNCALLFGKTR